jgi:hypothetical protein
VRIFLTCGALQVVPESHSIQERAMVKKAFVLGSALFLLCGVSGCGGDSHDKLIKEMIEVLDDASAAMAKIKGDSKENKTSKDTMNAVVDTLKKDGKKFKRLTRQSEDLGEHLDSEEKDRLKKEYHKKFQEAVANASKQWDRIKKIKGVKKELEDRKALEDFGYIR